MGNGIITQDATPTAVGAWTKKDLLGLRELSAEEIRLILTTAE